jgi:error-prone DNA polymerase
LVPQYGNQLGEFAVRLGIEYVRTIGSELAEKIEANRPYEKMEDVVRANGLTTPQVEALATAGAFGCFHDERRTALWSAGAVAQSKAGRLEGIVTGERSPQLPLMDDVEQTAADLWATGVSPDHHPVEFVRGYLDERGAIPADQLSQRPDGERVLVAGLVTHRQRPATAAGTTFLNLEDETGLVNVILSKGVWNRFRRIARSASAMVIQGKLEKAEGTLNVVAQRLEALPLSMATKSRDFR